MVEHPAEFGAGSTISAVTLRVAAKMIKELGIKPIKVSAVTMEKGGGKDLANIY